MYEINPYILPKGENFSDFVKKLVRNIKAGKDVEESKDILFRMTYRIAVQELKKYSYIGEPEDLLGDMSVAFMKTINYFDPDNKDASFMNYYKRCINSEILTTYYGKHRKTPESRENYRYFVNGVRSLDEPVSDKNDVETATLTDLIVDNNSNIDDEIDRIAMEDVMRRALDEIFSNTKGLRKRGKEIFAYYVECCIAGRDVKQIEIAKECGASRGNVSNIMSRYKPMFIDILKREGYIHE